MGLAHSPRIVTDGLVFCFDAANIKSYPGSGTNSYDIIGELIGNNVNSPTYTTSNKGYFSFATNTSIEFPNSTNLDTQTPSVEIWARINTTSQNGFLFEKGTVNSQYSVFFENTALRWRHRITSGSLLNTISVTTSSYINTVNWFQIITTWTSGSQKMYINGVEVGSATQVGTISTNSGGMSLGAYGGYTGENSYFLNGDISCVRVYNKVISPIEVQQNFNALRGRYGI